MSRVGKHPVVIPDGAEVRYEGAVLSAKGRLGELSFPVSEDLVEVELADGRIAVRPRDESKQARAMWGTTRALAQNIVTGVSQGFTRNLEIIGEATKRLSPDFRDRHPGIPWRSMAALRDVLAHGYMSVDLEIVWDVVENRLGDLNERIQALPGRLV